MMIEKLVLDYLAEKLDDVPVRMEHDETITGAEWVIIQKTGSSLRNGVRAASIAVQSYSSDSLVKAAKLNESVIDALLALPDEEDVFSCSLNSDYNFTDTRTKNYRYQAIFDITY